MGKKTHGPYLIAAIEHNDHEKVGEILTQNIRPKEKVKDLIYSDVKRLASEHTECPLLLASCLPDPSILIYFTKKHNVDINYVKKVPSGRRIKLKTALITAVRNGLYDTVDGILGLQADPNIQDHKERTPLHHAVRKADYRMAKMLLSRGAQANLTDMGENTPLHVASIFGHTQLVKLLMHYNADQYKKGQHGAIPIIIAAKEGHVDLLRHFCLKTENVNLKIPCYDEREKSALHVAAEGGHHECISLLVEDMSADVNNQDSEGETPLTCCVINEYDPMGMKSKEDYTECVRILLKNGADVNRQNGRGETALHLAARNEFHKIVDVLIQAGADPLLMDNNNDKPIDLVSEDDTVSRQALKQAQEDRERYLNDMLEMQAKGYSTSLGQLPGRSMTSLMSGSYGSSLHHAGRAGSMPGLMNGPGSMPVLVHQHSNEDSYLQPMNQDRNQGDSLEKDRTYDQIHSDDSYAPDQNESKSGSMSSLSKVLQQKLSEPKGRKLSGGKVESSDSSFYGDVRQANMGKPTRSRSVDMLGSPTANQRRPHTTQNTPHKHNRSLPSPPPSPRSRLQRESVMTEMSAMTEATSIWDDDITPRSSVSTFVQEQPQKPAQRLDHLKQAYLEQSKKYVYADSSSAYETLPDERVGQQPMTFKPAHETVQPKLATPEMSDSDDTFFDDESFDTMSENTLDNDKPRKKPQTKPKPKIDLKKRAIENRQKQESQTKKNDPALQSWLNEQAQLLKERNVEDHVSPLAQSTPPTTKRGKSPVPTKPEVTVNASSSPGVKQRVKALQSGSPVPPPRPPKEAPVPAQRKAVAAQNPPDDDVSDDSTFDDLSSTGQEEEEDSPTSGHHAAVLYDSQRNMQAPPQPEKRKVNINKPPMSTFQPPATSTLKTEEPLPPQQESESEDSSDSSEGSYSDTASEDLAEDPKPKYAVVNKAPKPAFKPAPQPVSTSVPAMSQPVGQNLNHVPQSQVGQVHVSPNVGQVHAVPTVGQVHHVPQAAPVPHTPIAVVPKQDPPLEDIYHEIPAENSDSSTQDSLKRKSVTIGNDMIIPNNVKRPDDFDHRLVSYDTMGIVPFSLVGGNADGVFVHNLEPNTPAMQSGLMDADQILRINNQSIKGKTREEVLMILNSTKTIVNLVVRNKKDRYNQIVQNGGSGDSFFVKSYFNYNDPKSGEMIMKEGEIFAVNDTLPQGKQGSWQGMKVHPNTSENGYLPNNNRAEQIAINMRMAAAKAKEKQQRGGLLRRSFGRSKSVDRLNKSRDGDRDLELNLRDIIAYEKVVQKIPSYKQPVVLLGLFCDAARDLLQKSSPGMFVCPEEPLEIPVSNNRSLPKEPVNMNLLRSIIAENKHCLTIVSPRAIQYLQKSAIKPIVIYLHPGNKIILKAVRQKLAPDFERNISKMVDEATEFEKKNEKLFTAKVTYSVNDDWFSLLNDTINRIQHQPQWVAVEDDEDDENGEAELQQQYDSQLSKRKMNMSCDDIPDQINNILNRHATNPARNESTSSAFDDMRLRNPSSSTNDGYHMTGEMQQQPQTPVAHPTDANVLMNNQKPRSILKSNGNADSASNNSSSSSSLNGLQQGQQPFSQPAAPPLALGVPVRSSSPATTPPRGPMPQPGMPMQRPPLQQPPMQGFPRQQVPFRGPPIQNFRQPPPQTGPYRQPPVQMYNRQPVPNRPMQMMPGQPPRGQPPRQMYARPPPPPNQGQQMMHPRQPPPMRPMHMPPPGGHPGMGAPSPHPMGMHPAMNMGFQQQRPMQPQMQQTGTNNTETTL